MSKLLNQAHAEQIVEEIVARAQKKGASAAEVSIEVDTGFSATVRLGEVDTLEHQGDRDLHLTVYAGDKTASVSSTDFRAETLAALVDKACHIVQHTGDDSCSGLADADLMPTSYPDLDLFHSWGIGPAEGIELAKRCEQAALDYDTRITNSEGATVNTHDVLHTYGNTHGFVGSYFRSQHSVSCCVIAEKGDDKQRDYDYTVACRANQLDDMGTLASRTAERTLRRLGARQLSTRTCPVLFHADLASGLIGQILQAAYGSSLYRKRSFLLDQLNAPIFAKHINIYEHPDLKQGLFSVPFDAEGVRVGRSDLIVDGVLKRYILSSYSARKLNMTTTGNAGGLHNVFVSHQDIAFEQLLKQMDTGLLVTELIGQGTNLINGDYSRGAFGYWVEKGEIQHPVHEITIAGNLKTMMQRIVAISNDVEQRRNVRCGSMLVDGLTLAGAG